MFSGGSEVGVGWVLIFLFVFNQWKTITNEKENMDSALNKFKPEQSVVFATRWIDEIYWIRNGESKITIWLLMRKINEIKIPNFREWEICIFFLIIKVNNRLKKER